MDANNLSALGRIYTCLLLLFASPLAADVLYEQDFENVYDEAMLGEVMITPEDRSNQWTLQAKGGAAQSASLRSPSGQSLPAIAKSGFEGFATHSVISVSVDTLLSLRFEHELPWPLPFSVHLLTDVEDTGSAVAGFQVHYAPSTGGETTEYNIHVPGADTFIWNPASAMETFQQSETDSSVAGWFRWTATFRLDAGSSMLKTTVSVAGIGQEGFDAPEPIQTWDFEPVVLGAEQHGKPLHLGIEGRAREGFGVTAADNLRVISGEATP